MGRATEGTRWVGQQEGQLDRAKGAARQIYRGAS